MSTVALTRFPNLQGMMDDFRSLINDDGGGADGPQGGIIATNDAPFTLPFMNRAIRWVYRQLKNVGDPQLVLDNYLVLGLPALSRPNPAVQVSLGFGSYFDGYQQLSAFTLPAGMLSLESVWERQAGSDGDFVPMDARPNLAGLHQCSRMGVYEYRGNALWMPGALVSTDLRLRCTIGLPSFQGAALDFENTYVPLIDCEDAIVDKALVYYARRFAPDRIADADGAAKESIADLRRAIARQKQRVPNQRADFGEEAVAGFGWVGDL